MGVGCQRHTPAALPSVASNRRLGGPQGRSGRVRKISSPPEFDPQTIQPAASRYTDYVIPIQQSNLYVIPIQQSNLYVIPIHQCNLYVIPIHQSNLYVIPIHQSNLYVIPIHHSNLYVIPIHQSNLYVLNSLEPSVN
jgi:hypothetical protein